MKKNTMSLKEIFQNAPNTMVNFVWKKGKILRIDPTISQEVTCPQCGSSYGYTVLLDGKVSATNRIWGCLEDKCIKENTWGAKKTAKLPI